MTYYVLISSLELYQGQLKVANIQRMERNDQFPFTYNMETYFEKNQVTLILLTDKTAKVTAIIINAKSKARNRCIRLAMIEMKKTEHV